MTEWEMTCEDCGGEFDFGGESEYNELLRCGCGSQYAVTITKLCDPDGS